MPKVDNFDGILTFISEGCKNDYFEFFDVIFEYLSRKTDFYVDNEDEAREEVVLKALRRNTKKRRKRDNKHFERATIAETVHREADKLESECQNTLRLRSPPRKHFFDSQDETSQENDSAFSSSSTSNRIRPNRNEATNKTDSDTESPNFNYDHETFWDKIPKVTVIVRDQSSIVSATKEMISGLFLKKKSYSVSSLALNLSFYVTRSINGPFLYENVLKFTTSPKVQKIAETVDLSHVKADRWFEEWNKTSPRTNTEKYFQTLFNTDCNNDLIAFFGPWFATTLLRLDRKDSASAAHKISKLPVLLEFNLNVEAFQGWQQVLNNFSAIKLFKPKKFALLKAMIDLYKQSDNSLRNVLHFIMLQTLYLDGMALFKLISGTFGGSSSSTLSFLRKVTSTPDTIQSWQTYEKFTNYLQQLQAQDNFYWRYARVFDQKAFEELSYSKNMKLCNYLAVINDMTQTPNVFFTDKNPGRMYTILTRDRKNSQLLNKRDFIFCWNAYKDYLFEFEIGKIDGPSCLLKIQRYEALLDDSQKKVEEAVEYYNKTKMLNKKQEIEKAEENLEQAEMKYKKNCEHYKRLLKIGCQFFNN